MEKVLETKEWLLGLKMAQVENQHLDELIEIIKKWAEEDRIGKGHEADYPETKELVLKALAIYTRHGLTPAELYSQRNYLLLRPDEKWNSRTLNSISMLLSRVGSNGLAVPIKEGKTIRYFINSNGKNRLEYYKRKRREKQRQESEAKEFARAYASAIERDTQSTTTIAVVQQFIEVLAESFPSRISEAGSYIGKRLVDIAGVINLQLAAIGPGANSELRLKAMEQSGAFLEKIKIWQAFLGISIKTAGQQEQPQRQQQYQQTGNGQALATIHAMTLAYATGSIRCSSDVSSAPIITSSAPIITSSNPIITSSNPIITSSNPIITSGSASYSEFGIIPTIHIRGIEISRTGRGITK